MVIDSDRFRRLSWYYKCMFAGVPIISRYSDFLWTFCTYNAIQIQFSWKPFVHRHNFHLYATVASTSGNSETFISIEYGPRVVYPAVSYRLSASSAQHKFVWPVYISIFEDRFYCWCENSFHVLCNFNNVKNVWID